MAHTKARFFSRTALIVSTLFMTTASVPAFVAAQTHSATLTLKVTGAHNTKGKIGIALFQDATGFPEDASRAFRAQPGQ